MLLSIQALKRALILALCLNILTPSPEAKAEPVSLLNNAYTRSAPPFSAPRGALITASTGPVSMFDTSSNIGFFAPLPPRLDSTPQSRRPTAYYSNPNSRIDRLRAIIGRAESSVNGYDAVQHAAKIKPAKAPTQMTLREIYAWIDATPGQQHAIGRYQFIPKTLKRLVTILGADLDDTFDPEMQNALSDILLLEAGYNDVLTGSISRHNFMNNLAKIWAGLPNTSGKSHYHGYAGNRASITWAEFEAEMKVIFPQSVKS